MELTRKQLRQQDFVDNKIHRLLTELFEDVQPHNQQGSLHWNIEDIGIVRDAVLEVFQCLGVNEQDFYPFIEEEN